MGRFGNVVLWLFELITKRPIVFGAVVVIVVISLAYGGWHLKRWFNWELAYGNDVKAVVCEMVRPDALRDWTRCLK